MSKAFHPAEMIGNERERLEAYEGKLGPLVIDVEVVMKMRAFKSDKAFCLLVNYRVG